MAETPRKLTIDSFEAKLQKKRPFSVILADELTRFFGSLWFLVLNITVFVFWIMANSGKIPGVATFDPYPFVLLITAVSLEAIILTTIVLMSQNRSSYINTLRSELQLQFELISEKEITKVLKLVRLLMDKQGIKIRDEELKEMLNEVDTAYVEKKLEKQIFESSKPLAEQITDKVINKK